MDDKDTKSNDPAADAEAARIRKANEDAAKADASANAGTRRQRKAAAKDEPETDPDADQAGAEDQQKGVFVTEGLDSDRAKLAQHEQVDRENEQRNAQNAEGHEKNVEADERLHEEGAYKAKETAPPTGKARDLNTPTVRPDGSKVW